MEVLAPGIPVGHPDPVHGARLPVLGETQVRCEGQDLLHRRAQGIPNGHSGDPLGLRIEGGDPAVCVRGEQAAHQALDGSLVERLQLAQVRGALAERFTGALELVGQEAGQRRHQHDGPGVARPDREEHRPRVAAPFGTGRSRVGRQEHTAVAHDTESGGDEGPPPVEEERAVGRHQQVEEGEDRVRAPGKMHQRRDDRDVRGDVDGGEESRLSDPGQHDAIQGGGQERESHRPVEPAATQLVHVVHGGVQRQRDAEAHQRQRQPRGHQDHQALLERTRTPQDGQRAVPGRNASRRGAETHGRLRG
jgi:hypothetical protein